MPSTTIEEFPNTLKKPLDQLTFDVDEGGVTIKVPALDKRWIKARVFSNYIGLVGSGGKLKKGADLEEWIYEAEWFRKDMEFLLRCRHHEFWSYMVYEKSAAIPAIVSFLQFANPFYLDFSQQTEATTVLELYNGILNCVIRIICRLITNRESPTKWITKEHLRELLYSNFLISIPMLLDLIVAVGDLDEHNLNILSRIFNTLFQLEPKYEKDLTAALSFFPTAFRSIQIQSENEGFDGAGGGAADDNLDTPYDDVVLYTLDTAYTLSILMEVCPNVHTICHDLQLARSIAQFYDNTIPFLYKNIFLINDEACSLSWLNMARVQLLKAFRSIANSYLMTVLTDPKNSLAPSENFVGLLIECLSERTFVIDYQREYSVELDMELLKQACKNLDNFKADFVMKGYQQEAETYTMTLATNIADNKINPNPNPKSNAKNAKQANEQNGIDANIHLPQNGTTVQQKRNIDLEVSAALDILPHLGTGFLRRVLLRYENSEDAIAAILEENLPPDLVGVDQSEVYIPSDPQDTLYRQTGLQHFNIYDGDSYDIMSQDNPACIIKVGKGFPNAPKNASELLDDKRGLAAIRHRYQAYSLVSDDVDDANGEYEDEYDDSYESVLETETRTVRSKQLKAGLADIEDATDDESDDSSEEKTEEKSEESTGLRCNGKQLNFCENPESVRARYEAKRAAKANRINAGSGSRDQWSNAKTADVTGAPKGRGQDKDVLRNRNNKEVHKATRSNHNRKGGAAYKRSKGMFA